eukprot:1161547-Pelagomonas_calceolata.AAC.10
MGQIARRPTGEVPWIPASLQPIAGLLCKASIVRATYCVLLAWLAPHVSYGLELVLPTVLLQRQCLLLACHGGLLQLLLEQLKCDACVTCHRFFEGFMVALAVGASVLLCFDVLSLDPNSTRGIIVRSLDTAFTFFFGVEVRALWYLSHYAMLSEVLSSQGAVTVPMQAQPSQAPGTAPVDISFIRIFLCMPRLGSGPGGGPVWYFAVHLRTILSFR